MMRSTNESFFNLNQLTDSQTIIQDTLPNKASKIESSSNSSKLILNTT